MTETRDATLQPHEPVSGGPAWRDAAEAGFDMSLIVCSLRMPVWERIREHRSALQFATMLRAAHLKTHAGSRKAA